MNAMAPIEGLEGSGKPLFHISGSSVIADKARDFWRVEFKNSLFRFVYFKTRS